MEKIKIEVNGTEYNAVIESDNDDIIINGKKFNVHKFRSFTPNITTYLVNNKIMLIEHTPKDKNTSSIIADGFFYDVTVCNEMTEIINKYMASSNADSESGQALVKAPMPGMIVKILVEKGMQVNKGDKILIIEAMKMENSIVAPISGTIKNIHVRENQAVEKEALLTEIERINK